MQGGNLKSSNAADAEVNTTVSIEHAASEEDPHVLGGMAGVDMSTDECSGVEVLHRCVACTRARAFSNFV